MKSNAWTPNVQSHYGYDSLRQLQDQWLAWVAGGSGPVESFVSARNAAPVALTASAPSAPIASTPDPASLVAGPTSGSESWYQRRREQTARGPNATLTSTPPTNSGSEPASHPDPVSPDPVSPATVYTPAAALIGPPSVTNII